MAKPILSIQLAPPDGESPGVQWTVSGRWFYAIVGVAVLLVGLFGFLVTRVVELARKADQVDALMRRNVELEVEAQKVTALEEELASLREFDGQIRGWLGLTADSEPARALSPAGPVPRPIAPEEWALIANPRFDGRSAGLDPAALGRSFPVAWPLEGWITSEFGESRPSGEPHSGIDIAAPSGSAVLAAAAGRVAIAAADSTYGEVIVLDHGGDLFTLYGHNASLEIRKGDVVSAGQKIASVGSTGRSTAPHLHFEVRRGKFVLDPRDFLPPQTDLAIGSARQAGAAVIPEGGPR